MCNIYTIDALVFVLRDGPKDNNKVKSFEEFDEIFSQWKEWILERELDTAEIVKETAWNMSALGLFRPSTFKYKDFFSPSCWCINSLIRNASKR